MSEAVVARWFASEGVPARYRITALSTDKVILQDVTLGPAAAPDFRARQIDVRLGWSLFQPRVAAVTLLRPSLRAELGPHGLSLGSLVRLLPAPGGTAAPLPDLDVTLIDASATLTTRAGTLVATGNGAGRLRGGFAGHVAIGDTRLSAAGCTGRLPGAKLVLTTTRAEIRVGGDGVAARGACATGAAIDGIGWHADVRLPPNLDRYRAVVTARTGAARAVGFSARAMEIAVDGTAATLAGPVAGSFAVAGRGVTGPSSAAGRVAAAGSYRVDPKSDSRMTAKLVVSRATVSLPLRPLTAASAQLAGTLAAPLATVLAARLDAAAHAFDATGTVTLARGNGVTTGTIAGGTITAATGARLAQAGRVSLTGSAVALDGGVTLAGGGLPSVTIDGAGRWEVGAVDGNGTLTVARWAVPGATIEASRLAFAANARGATLSGTFGVSGAIGGGIIATGLVVPVDVRIGRDGGIVFGEHCLPLVWSGLARATVRLTAGRLTACPSGGAMLRVADDRLQGDVAISGAAMRGVVANETFALTAAPLRLGASGTVSDPRVDLAPVTLAGQLGPRRARATISGTVDIASASGRGQVAEAAFDDPGIAVGIDEGKADWRLAGARIDFARATARIVDHTVPARFQPVRIADGTVSLADGVVLGQGDVVVAATSARLGRVVARHNIASGSGSATLDTGTLAFGPALQPTDITESLRGIVANVRGPVAGTGRVDWTANSLTSRGVLRIDAVSLATEALGPVDGIAGTIVLDDLLALTTPPGQSLKIARINPGVVVDAGVAVFRMLGPDAAAIESIRWPYAGGTLALSPVTIRASDVRRDFLLTVDGIDAQQFLQRFEIANLNVTGHFDGKLPLVFADGHGRIVGGRLVSRPGGGLVQYVGEIGTAETGAAARLAFDALRRLRYQNLTLDLDGDLDGELVTQVHFAGNNEAAATLAGGPVPIKVTGLPFRFGITVRAPFRALLGTAASFSDVRPLLRAAPTTPPTVQPK